MLNALRRIAKRPTFHDPRDDRRIARLHGPLVDLLQRDLANLDALTKALSWPRG